MTAQFFGAMLAMVAAFIVLVVLLPFVASLVLDGMIAAWLGRGAKGLLVALAVTGASVLLGVLALAAGHQQAVDFPQLGAFRETMAANTHAVLPFTIGLAAVAFVVRTVRGFLRG